MSEEIQRWRREVDATDRELLRLLSRRARAVLRIGACKRAAGIAVLDRPREREVLARVRSENPGPLSGEAVERLFAHIIRESRALEGAPHASPPALTGRGA